MPAHRVPLTIAHVAARTAERVAERLGIEVPKVQWLPANTVDRRGCTYPQVLTEVWVRAGQSRAATVESTAHECRHLWQLQDFHWLGFGLDSMELRELDAANYGREQRRLWTGG